jgi:hypothetical protein
VHDLTGPRHSLDARELDPFHVSDDRNPHGKSRDACGCGGTERPGGPTVPPRYVKPS